MKTTSVKIIPNAPWFDGEYGNLRKMRRKAEKQFKRSGLSADKENYKRLRKQTTALAYQKKKDYYCEKLVDVNNGKVLFSVVNKLLDNKQEEVLPTSKSEKELADCFMQYFLQKISKLRSKFTEVDKTTEIFERNHSGIKCLSTF